MHVHFTVHVIGFIVVSFFYLQVILIIIEKRLADSTLPKITFDKSS
jgi:hypothetical protein